MADYIRDLRPAKWGSVVKLYSSNLQAADVALGSKYEKVALGIFFPLLPQERTFGGGAGTRQQPPRDDFFGARHRGQS